MDNPGQEGGHYSISEAAKFLGVTPRTIRRYLKSGKLFCLDKTVSGGIVKIPKHVLISFLSGVTPPDTGMTSPMTISVKKPVRPMTNFDATPMTSVRGLPSSQRTLISFLTLLVIILFFTCSILFLVLFTQTQTQEDEKDGRVQYGRPPALTFPL